MANRFGLAIALETRGEPTIGCARVSGSPERTSHARLPGGAESTDLSLEIGESRRHSPGIRDRGLLEAKSAQQTLYESNCPEAESRLVAIVPTQRRTRGRSPSRDVEPVSSFTSPGQELRHAVDLIVKPPMRKGENFEQKVFEPIG